MNNPYQAPNTETPIHYNTNSTEREIQATTMPLDPSWTIGRGWKLVCQNFKMFFLAITLPVIISSIASSIMNSVARGIDGVSIVDFGNGVIVQQTNYGVASLFAMIVGNILGLWIGLGIIRVTLDYLDGKPISFSTAFSQGHKVVTAFFATLLFSIAMTIGFLLLIFPGIYIATTYSFYMHAIVDKNKGIMESFEYSKQLTKNNKVNVFVLGILSMLVGIAGALALMIGLLWAVPAVYIAFTVAYCCLHHGKTQQLEQL